MVAERDTEGENMKGKWEVLYENLNIFAFFYGIGTILILFLMFGFPGYFYILDRVSGFELFSILMAFSFFTSICIVIIGYYMGDGSGEKKRVREKR